MDSNKSQQISNRIWFISACNPNYFTLCGTNIFLIGEGKNKTMIDCGHPGNQQFQSNLKRFLIEHDFSIEVALYAFNSLQRILISHSHIDHLGGSGDVLKVLQAIGQKQMPNICRFYLKNFFYRKACEMETGDLLEKHVINVREGDVFRVDDYATIKVIETPGHLEDHLCFLLEAPGEPSYLFTGDHILGSKTTTYTNYIQFMNSLYKLRDMKGIDRLCVGHSHELSHDHIVLDAKKKIQDMIDERLKKDKRTLETLKKFEKLSLDDLYDRMYESNYKDNKYSPFFKKLLRLQLEKYVDDMVIRKRDGFYLFPKL